MSNRPVRFRGTDYPVIERFRLGGRTYLAVAKLGAAPRRAYRVFDTAAKTMRALHVLPDTTGTWDRVKTLQRITRGDNEILQVLDCHRRDDCVWVVLPWIDGFNLRSVLNRIRDRKQPRIAAPEAARLMKGVAHALRHLHHRKQIIHGDVKPANLLLTSRTSLILIDYGNAWRIERTTSRHDGDGVSAVYAAPEFVCGQRSVNFRADIFSVGVVLYELLTSKIPFDGHGGKVGLLPNDVRSGCCLVPVSRISPERDAISQRIWTQIDSLLTRSLAIEPDARFETPGAWLDAWTEVMREVQDAKRRAKPTRLAVRFLDWIESRLR